MLSIHTTGIEGLSRDLKALGRFSVPAVKSALGKSATPTVQAFRSGAPVRTGALRQSFGKESKGYAKSGDVTVGIGVRAGFVKGNKRPRDYAGSVEKRGKSKGWAARVWGRESQKIKPRFGEALWKSIARYAAKLGGK